MPGYSPSFWEAKAARDMKQLIISTMKSRENKCRHTYTHLVFFVIIQFRISCLGIAATHSGCG